MKNVGVIKKLNKINVIDAQEGDGQTNIYKYIFIKPRKKEPIPIFYSIYSASLDVFWSSVEFGVC